MIKKGIKNKLKKQNLRGKTHNLLKKNLLAYVLILTSIGIIAVADASAPLAMKQFGDKFFFVKQQLYAGVLGIILMIVVSNINYKLWEKFAVHIFAIMVALLVLVLIPGFGNKLLGARRWLVLGPVNFQPAELMKLSLAIYVAKVAAINKKPFAYFAPLILVSLLVMLQPDLGTTLVLVSIGIIQMYSSGINIFYFLSFLGFGVFSAIGLIFSSEYRRERLLSFISQAQSNEPSYHIRQVLLAIGSGGLFGVGLGQSRQKFLFIPESASDSIFAIIAEEAGFLRSSILILVYLLFIITALRYVNRVEDKFGKILGIGLISWVFVQTVLNLFSMLAITPITGVPLPFISYGGTSLVMILISMGILLNITRYAKE